MIDFLRRYCRYFFFLYDLAVIPFSWFLAYTFRYGIDSLNNDSFFLWQQKFPFVFSVQVLLFLAFNTKRAIWKFFSIKDFFVLILSTVIALTASLLLLHTQGLLFGNGLIIYAVYLSTLCFTLCFGRIFVRAFSDLVLKKARKADKKILIVGAGKLGVSLLRSIRSQENSEFSVCGFLDDDLSLRKCTVDRVPVLGTLSEIKSVLESAKPDMIVIAMFSIPPKSLRSISKICESSNVPVRITPSTQDIISDKFLLQSLKEISLEDLLGRDPIQIEQSDLLGFINNKVVLVTGAGGSIGSELCRQIACHHPKILLITDISEFNLYSLELEFSASVNEVDTKFILLDVNDKAWVKKVIEDYKPHIVFHAAAYKHVPLLEAQARQAIRNNLLGACTLADQCVVNNVEKFVLISTDKAVNPTNIMGTTKRLAEIYCQNLNHHLELLGNKQRTRFITVRFGNVLGSAGSVVPLFREQLKRGGPLTVTHPEITRYFMTIPEASQLVLQAAQMGDGGEIFVLDMGKPIKIVDLAEKMIQISGKTPYQDVDIVFTGLRPGEKLFEELFHHKEALGQTNKEKILIAQSRFLDFETLQGTIKEIIEALDEGDEKTLVKGLLSLVPEAALTSFPRTCATSP